VKHKTSELTGEALNQAVANANAEQSGVVSYADYCGMWEYGGPIIEKFGIGLFGKKTIADPICFSHWKANIEGKGDFFGTRGFVATGPTPLIAAMRVFVLSQHGNEVDL
jgi:hypothetical protein